MRDSATVRRTFALFAAALLVRAAAAAATGIGGPPVEDEIDYVRIAHQVAEGNGFVLPWSASDGWGLWGAVPETPRTAFRPPALPAVLAPLALLGGDVVAMRWVSIFVGALAAPLAYRALRRTSLGERALWVGAALAAWPPAVYLSLRVLTEPLAQAFLLGSMAVRDDDDRRFWPGARSVLAGALAGASVLARPAGIVAGVLLAFCRGSLRRTAWFAAGLAVVVGPWVVRNAAIHGRPLLSTNTGVTLVGANSAAAASAEWPGKWLPPDVVYAQAGQPPDLWMWGWSDLTEAESDRRFTSDAVDWTFANPGAACALAAKKVVRLFDPDQHSAKPDAGLKRLLGWATFAPVLVLAAVGLARARGDPAMRPWLAVLAATLIVTVVFYGDVRMRSPADPTLLAIAALGVHGFLRSPRASGSAAGPGR